MIDEEDFRPPQRPQRIDRICLGCDRAFVAEGRYNRLCPRCAHRAKLEIHCLPQKLRFR